MSINATESVTRGMYTTPADPTLEASSQADKDTFLALMVAQLKYQDPMNPTDSGQFLAQTAQFTSLEKMEDVAEATTALLASQQAFSASSMLGSQVTYRDATGQMHTGVVSRVHFSADGPAMQVGDTRVALGDLVSVAFPTTPETPSDGSTGDPNPS